MSSLVAILTPSVSLFSFYQGGHLSISEVRILPGSSERNPTQSRFSRKGGSGERCWGAHRSQKSCTNPGDLKPGARTEGYVFLGHTLFSPTPLAFSLLARSLPSTSLLWLSVLGSDSSKLECVPALWIPHGGSMIGMSVVQEE